MSVTARDRVDAYRATRERFAALLGDVTQDQATTPVPACPGWSVADVLGHVVGISSAFQDGEYPSGDIDAWNAEQVGRRRGRAVAKVLEEWDSRAPGFEALMAGPLEMAAGHLVADIVSHEIDAQAALGLPRQLAPEAPLAMATFVQIQAGALDAAKLPALRIVTDAEEYLSGTGEPAATVRGDPFELLRALSGRRTHAEIRALDWTGDPTPYLEVFAPYPPPSAPLSE